MPSAKVSQIWGEFCESTSIHGFSNFYSTRHRLKLFWGLVLTIMFLCSCYGIIMVVIEYLKSPVITGFELVSEPEVKFPKMVALMAMWYSDPALSIVQSDLPATDQNPQGVGQLLWKTVDVPLLAIIAALGVPSFSGNLSSIVEDAIAEFDDAVLDQMFNGVNYRNTTEFMEQIEVWYDKLSPYIKTGDSLVDYAFDLPQFWKDLAFDTTKVIDGYSFQNVKYRSWMRESVISKVYDPSFGVCYLITAPKNQSVSNQGCNFLVNSFAQDAFQAIPIIHDGIKVRVSDDLDISEAQIYSVPISQYVDIFLQLTNYNLDATKTLGKCSDDIENRMLTNLPNSMSSCLLECRYQQTVRHCGCVLPTEARLLKPSSYPQCFFQIQCARDMILEENQLTSCINKCKPACTYLKYTGSISYAQFPSKVSQGKIVKNFPEEGHEFISQHSLIHVAFADLLYFKVEQSMAISFESLVAQIGGQLGLFLGCSIISIIHFFFYLAQGLTSAGLSSVQRTGRSAKTAPKTVAFGHHNQADELPTKSMPPPDDKDVEDANTLKPDAPSAPTPEPPASPHTANMNAMNKYIHDDLNRDSD